MKISTETFYYKVLILSYTTYVVVPVKTTTSTLQLLIAPTTTVFIIHGLKLGCFSFVSSNVLTISPISAT